MNVVFYILVTYKSSHGNVTKSVKPWTKTHFTHFWFFLSLLFVPWSPKFCLFKLSYSKFQSRLTQLLWSRVFQMNKAGSFIISSTFWQNKRILLWVFIVLFIICQLLFPFWISPKICCSLKNWVVDYFTLTALHSADKFSNEQQILGLNLQIIRHAFSRRSIRPHDDAGRS